VDVKTKRSIKKLSL